MGILFFLKSNIPKLGHGVEVRACYSNIAYHIRGLATGHPHPPLPHPVGAGQVQLQRIRA